MEIGVIYPFTSTWLDYPDNNSVALSVFIMGCNHKCKGCSNPEFSDLNYQNAVDMELDDFIKTLKEDLNRNRTNKVALLGGDPLHPSNILFIKEFLDRTVSIIDTCIYTGYNIDYVKKNNVRNFKFIKCGVYKKDLSQSSEKTDNYIQFASKNQELFDSNFKLLTKNGRFYFNGGLNDRT